MAKALIPCRNREIPKSPMAAVTTASSCKHDERTDEYRSVSPWPHYQEGASSGELKHRFGWTHPILFSPANPKQLFIAAQYVFRSDDYGATWTQISPDLTRNEPSTEAPSGGPVDLDQSGAEIYPSGFGARDFASGRQSDLGRIR